MRMMYDIIVFENPRFRPSTSKGEVGVFKKLHFGDYFGKAAFTETVFTGYLRTVGRTGEKISPFKQKRIREDRPLTYCFLPLLLTLPSSLLKLPIY